MSQAVWTSPSLGAGREPGLGARLGAAVAGMIESVEREWRVRRDVRILESMSAHQLADIGVGLGGAEDAVRNGRPRLARPQTDAGFHRTATARTDRLMPLSWTEWR